MNTHHFSAFLTGLIFLTLTTLSSFCMSADRDVTISGDQMYTAPLSIGDNNSTAELVYDNYILPNDDTLFLSILFTGQVSENSLTAFFNGIAIPVAMSFGADKKVDLVVLDISSVKNQTGIFKLVLTNSGTTVSDMILIDTISDPEDVVVAPQAALQEVKAGSTNILTLCILFVIAYIKTFLMKRRFKFFKDFLNNYYT